MIIGADAKALSSDLLPRWGGGNPWRGDLTLFGEERRLLCGLGVFIQGHMDAFDLPFTFGGRKYEAVPALNGPRLPD